MYVNLQVYSAKVCKPTGSYTQLRYINLQVYSAKIHKPTGIHSKCM